jgi:hypothetical protein
MNPDSRRQSSGRWAAAGETRLSSSGSFDMLNAPVVVGPFVGDYTGLTSSPTAFASTCVMAKPQPTNGPTDLFSNTAP